MSIHSTNIISRIPSQLQRDLVCQIEASAELQQRFITYFEKMGFKIAEQKVEAGKWRFEKGSHWGNAFTFNPLKWKSAVEIELQAQQLTARFYMHTTNQFPSVNDEQLWDAFVAHFEKYLHQPAFDFKTANAQALKIAQRKNRKYLIWGIFGGLLIGIPAGFLAHWLNMPIIASIGAASGGLALMSKKIKEDRVKAGLYEA